MSEAPTPEMPEACRIGHLRVAGPLQHNRGAMRRVLASLLCLAAAAHGGCLFVDTINSPPSAEIRRPDLAEVFRGGSLKVQAVVDDPDGDGVEIRWSSWVCNAGGLICRQLPSVLGGRDVHEVAVPVEVEPGVLVERVAVELVARDERGASPGGVQILEVPVENAPPELPFVQAQWRSVDTRFPVDAPITIFVRAQDADSASSPVDVDVELFRDGQPVTDVALELEPSDDEAGLSSGVLRPDATGRWTAVFTARDALGKTGTRELVLDIVDDSHPCIESLSPAFAGPLLVEAPRRFAVLGVSDDRDEYPAQVAGELGLGVATFRWSRSRPDAPGHFDAIGGVEAADLVVDPAAYAPGDRFAIRVDVDDRIERQACEDDDDRCAVERDGVTCARRMTWEVEIR
jgi:hypothetical protein